MKYFAFSLLLFLSIASSFARNNVRDSSKLTLERIENFLDGTGSINVGDGSITGSTVYCYTGETLDKTVVYDESGTPAEQD